MIDKFVKYAPYLIGGGILLAVILLLTGNHVVYYERSTLCTSANCDTMRFRMSFPFIIAIFAILDGITLLLVKHVVKKNPPINPAAQNTPVYDPDTGGYNPVNPSGTGGYDPNNPGAYNPNTPNK